MAETAAATAETKTPEIIRLEHGCPNCGSPHKEPNPNPHCVIWFHEPGKEKAGLELCVDCVLQKRKISKKKIVTTLRKLGWPRTKLRAFEIGLQKHIKNPPVVYC